MQSELLWWTVDWDSAIGLTLCSTSRTASRRYVNLLVDEVHGVLDLLRRTADMELFLRAGRCAPVQLDVGARHLTDTADILTA